MVSYILTKSKKLLCMENIGHLLGDVAPDGRESLNMGHSVSIATKYSPTLNELDLNLQTHSQKLKTDWLRAISVILWRAHLLLNQSSYAIYNLLQVNKVC